jgi:hypothetical protein
VAAKDGVKDQFLKALPRVVVASVGPTCSERLKAHGIAIDHEPTHPKMGPLVQETALRAKEIMKKKAESRSQESGARSQNLEDPVSRVANPESRVPSPVSHVPSPVSRFEDSRFMKACRFEAVDATPIWLMRQAGRYMQDYRDLRARVPFLDLCKSPAWMPPSSLPICC